MNKKHNKAEVMQLLIQKLQAEIKFRHISLTEYPGHPKDAELTMLNYVTENGTDALCALNGTPKGIADALMRTLLTRPEGRDVFYSIAKWFMVEENMRYAASMFAEGSIDNIDISDIFNKN